VSLVLVSLLRGLVLPLWALCPLAYYLYYSVSFISILIPWYLEFRFTHWSSQFLDALVHKPQFIRWSTQFTDALVLKPTVFLFIDSYHTTIYLCKQHHLHNFNQNMLNILKCQTSCIQLNKTTITTLLKAKLHVLSSVSKKYSQ